MTQKGYPDVLDVSIDVNPLDLSINNHYRNKCYVVTPKVRAAQARIVDAVATERERLEWRQPVGPLGIELHYTFASAQGDIDNPEKRTIDAVSKGLAINDNRFVEKHTFRHEGIPGVRVKVYATVDPDGKTSRRRKATATFKLPDGTVIGA